MPFSAAMYMITNDSKKNIRMAAPFHLLVAGAGGYADLHAIAEPGDTNFPDNSPLLDDVELKNYCDDAHGFLKITVKKTSEGLNLKGEYFTIPHEPRDNEKATLYDAFEVKVAR